MKQTKKKFEFFLQIIAIQAIVAIYSFSTVVAKFASRQTFLSWQFLLLYAVEIGILGIYAILWQQMIKCFPISVAYANRAIGLLWTLLFATVFFQEKINLQNAIGVIIVIIGTMIVNSEDE
ncbi:MAG: EamA family transporter [Roseburia sp.]|uniref:EamA family transporter n=1 Tax=Roseburia sp. 831b TaxID=1261635 RepID=UPI001FA8B5E2|nr:EamA family transporter [Roseburia sp. 831b]MCI5920269.1 EamA family transporter [Roseburia sp.]WVK71971.1 EamA family transporter [Roseburia sp. 831b]